MPRAAADRVKQKAKREKQLAVVLSIVFVALLAIEGPKTLKQLSGHPNAPVVAAQPASATIAAPTALPQTSTIATAPASLISAVQPTVDPGQLRSFSRFASKDPFRTQATSGAASSATTGTGTTTAATSTPPATTATTPSSTSTTPAVPVTVPPPTSAVISLNGSLMSIAAGGDFPTSGSVFARVGSLFHLSAVTKKTAVITINGGSYASGAPTLTLTVGKPVTLQNTADGTRYTLLLEPQGTAVPVTLATSTTTTPTSTTPTSTTPASVLP